MVADFTNLSFIDTLPLAIADGLFTIGNQLLPVCEVRIFFRRMIARFEPTAPFQDHTSVVLPVFALVAFTHPYRPCWNRPVAFF